jgi:L-fuculose-phosphate aldolase
MSEAHTRREMLRIARLCYERNLLVAMDGNLSVRLDEDHILATKAGCHKGMLTDADLVVIDRRGNKVRGEGDPTSEMAMHLACYDARPDVRAVVHAHPPISVAFTIAGVSLAQCVLPEVVLTLGVVPTLDYRTTGTADLAALVGEHIHNHDAVLMDRHGAVCVGSDLIEAFCRLETMEHTALITKTARDMGEIKLLPPEEAAHLRSMGLKRYGGPPSAVAQADAPGADLPEACRACSGCMNPNPTGIGPSTTGSRRDLRMARVTATPLASLSNALSDAARFSLTGSTDASPPSALETAVTAAVIQALGDGQ